VGRVLRCCHANLIAYRRSEEGVERTLYLVRKRATAWGSVSASVRRRRQGRIAGKASHFISSSNLPTIRIGSPALNRRFGCYEENRKTFITRFLYSSLLDPQPRTKNDDQEEQDDDDENETLTSYKHKNPVRARSMRRPYRNPSSLQSVSDCQY
jgi:hypothetical protein